ncbi:MAG: hypothetical protein A2W29_07560 [Gemmatimonadetes bacterium RBG_16_66_8]|nr:MAG: hypothetical protein A2W29_07560 [Gemmatimonadetes bacterium RBG_16_66_8]
MERHRLRSLLIGAAILAAGAIVAGVALNRGDERPVTLPIPGVRDSVLVEVLNTTGVDGLAREATRRLRRAGIDVVSVGSQREDAVDSTVIMVRRGDASAGERVRAVLGFGRVQTAADPRLLLDVTVLLGPDAAGALSLHP